MSTLAKDSAAIKNDSELNELLKKLELIKTARTFKRWKSSFLDRLESFLDQENINTADQAYRKYATNTSVFVKLIHDVNHYVDKNELTVSHTTVKARKALNEMSKDMTLVILELEALLPQTMQLEMKVGYNKFHIGAVLVRDNFSEYARLDSCKDILQHMRTISLNQVADKQILDEMNNYSIKLKKFCEIMADLGLYEVMLKCIEFAEDLGPDLSQIIFLDCKTGCIGEIPREDCYLKHILSTKSVDPDGNDIIAEAVAIEEGREKLLKLIKENNKLQIGFGNKSNQFESETNVGITEMEKVQNMWGVKLKKTPKNEKGSEFVFVCQKTSQFGEMSRKNAIDGGLLKETVDEKTKKLIIAEAYMDFQERSDLVERIRTLLKLGIHD